MPIALPRAIERVCTESLRDMTDAEQWQAYYDYAGALKAAADGSLPSTGIVGRSITYLTDKLIVLWGKHKATLIPFLSQLAVAALEAIVANKASIDAVNPPGPR